MADDLGFSIGGALKSIAAPQIMATKLGVRSAGKILGIGGKKKAGPSEPAPSAPPPAVRKAAAKSGKAWYKNPLWWVLGAALVGGGIFLLRRKRATPATANPHRWRRLR